MKTIVKILVLCITTTLFANNKVEKEIGEFNTLKVYDLIEVELIKGETNKIEIVGDNAEDVVVVNNNGLLKIRMNLNKTFDGNNVTVKLYYTKIDIIDANEGSRIFSNKPLIQYELELKAQEGASILVDMDVKYATIKAVTGGNIQASGKSTSQNVALRTGGIYKAMDLETEKTDVSINAGGEAFVRASKLMDAKIRAGGTVFIYGSPQTINQSTVLGGTIKTVKD